MLNCFFRQTTQRVIIALLVAVFVRIVTLGLSDLIDPTESRYAFVAQEMVLSGDWITPKLPLPTGLEAYIGKPPLHFWLTAISMSLFGMDAWVARVPSFLGWLAIGVCSYLLAIVCLSHELALAASLVSVSAGLLFFLAGSSTVDVTFSAWISAALCSFAYAHQAKTPARKRWAGYLFFIFSACAFLTKGPAACILIGLPIAMWLLWRDSRAQFPRLPWIGGTLCFLAIVVPWFYLAEAANPGFLKYFFVQENFLRFVSKDYGDKFGTGHVYPRGSAIWMLAVGSLPWSVIAIWLLVYSREVRQRLMNLTTWSRFALLCAISPAIFFSLARQLHAAYVLPGFAALGVILIVLISEESPTRARICRIISLILTILAVGAIPVSLFFNATIFATIMSVFVMALYYGFTNRVCLPKHDLLADVCNVSVSCLLLYCIVFIQFAPHAGRIKSSRYALSQIAPLIQNKGEKTVFMTGNSYSFYYYPRVWERQLGAPITASYADLETIIAAPPDNMILNKSDLARLPESLKTQYALKQDFGKWKWWRKLAL